jgi:hypothetical protein
VWICPANGDKADQHNKSRWKYNGYLRERTTPQGEKQWIKKPGNPKVRRMASPRKGLELQVKHVITGNAGTVWQ